MSKKKVDLYLLVHAFSAPQTCYATTFIGILKQVSTWGEVETTEKV